MKLPAIAQSHYPEAFQWRAQTVHLTDRVFTVYLRVFLDTFLSILPELDENLERRFHKLSLRSKHLIVEAPDTYNQITKYLRHQDNRTREFLRRSITVEEARNGGRLDVCTGMWSANGDFLSDSVVNESRDAAGWRSRGRFFAPLLAGHIPLDHHSIFARHPMPVAEFRSVRFGDAESMTPTEEARAISKVMESFGKIAQSLPVAANFISRYVNSIILRKTSRTNDLFQSASRNAFIGQIVLLNPHQDHVDDEYMAESLLHESIHSLLWRAEILDHFIFDAHMDMGLVQSPWSGEKIFYYTLLQACFVWYGLFWFWNTILSLETPFCASRALELRERARSGFLKPEYASALDQNRINLKSGVLEVFGELRDRVIRAS